MGTDRLSADRSMRCQAAGGDRVSRPHKNLT